ncbi:copper chaperone PCu(A)C [Streptomyces sp. NPDC058459]|uniref:copper chaperone PCu(A)C n=1 Tax=Streptomyces sp. NPDC058459 TaxID=3346508 RepID=UPI00364E8325
MTETNAGSAVCNAASSAMHRFKRQALTAVAPIGACLVALGGLTAWTSLGHAGTPPDLEVTRAWVFQPTGATPVTAAFFRITNKGDGADALTEVTSPSVRGAIALSRHRMTPHGAAFREPADQIRVPALRSLDMTPSSSDVTVPADRDWRVGDDIWFDLRFEHSDTLRVKAEVVRPQNPK